MLVNRQMGIRGNKIFRLTTGKPAITLPDMATKTRPALVEIVREIAAEIDRQGLRQSDLARLSGVPQPTIYRIFNGERPDPQISTLNKLASALGLSIRSFRRRPKTV